jgi:hypothetical protein
MAMSFTGTPVACNKPSKVHNQTAERKSLLKRYAPEKTGHFGRLEAKSIRKEKCRIQRTKACKCTQNPALIARDESEEFAVSDSFQLG